MTPRNTNTGGVLEAMILPALQRGGYACQKQVKVGQRHGGGAHKVDAVATKEGRSALVSLKWQQTGGTAEQKVPFEVMCLAQAVMDGHAHTAYLVLGGDGWTLRDYYVSGKLAEHLTHAGHVKVVALEAFVRMANNGQL
ncbi:MAG: PD-(D/E)XK nuclease superfamily protein [Acidobacteriota bacterium]